MNDVTSSGLHFLCVALIMMPLTPTAWSQPDPLPPVDPPRPASSTMQPAETTPSPHGHDLHFSHPLITESPSPDTKVKLDYLFAHDEDEDEHTVQLEMEYAFAHWGSVGVNVPYTFLDPDDGPSASNLDNIEVSLKLACTSLEKHGVIFGGGVELGLPTGDDNKGIGSNNELEVEPFIDAGLKIDRLEVVGFLSFGIPTNESEDEKDEVDLELGYQLSLLYHVTPRFMVLFELDGQAVLSGHENESALNVVPGFKVKPWPDSPFELGAGVSLPVTRDKDFDVQAIFSMFYHF